MQRQSGHVSGIGTGGTITGVAGSPVALSHSQDCAGGSSGIGTAYLVDPSLLILIRPTKSRRGGSVSPSVCDPPSLSGRSPTTIVYHGRRCPRGLLVGS